MFKIRCIIGSLLFWLDFTPKAERWAGAVSAWDVFGVGYFPFKGRSAYHYGPEAYLFPVMRKKSIQKWLDEENAKEHASI